MEILPATNKHKYKTFFNNNTSHKKRYRCWVYDHGRSAFLAYQMRQLVEIIILPFHYEAKFKRRVQERK
jgi:hypothetical protein